MKINHIKTKIYHIFDENSKTKVLENVADYLIIGCILLSALNVFLSTHKEIEHQYGTLLHAIDLFTTIFFTIEIAARIWVADLINPKYSGFKGRLRYCFSLYGFIDIISTFPYYLHFIFPLPYTALKMFRIVRLLRVFRYIKAFSILKRAVMLKKEELNVSLQFLIIITLILSFILFFVEHEVQPEAYDNGFTSVIWAFAQYINDPGNFATTPPITLTGRIIAVIIGVLGIAIFAVPAGLIGSAFTQIMEEDTANKRKVELCQKLYNAFERKLDRITGFQIVPKFVTFDEIQARLGMTLDEIMIAAKESYDFRVIYLGSTRPMGEHYSDGLAVELCTRNTSYGCLIDRGSNITIVSPSNMTDPIIGHFAYYIATIGNFNYISREVGVQRPYKSFYIISDENETTLKEYMADLHQLTERKNAWCWTLLASSGAQEPAYPTKFHFGYGGNKSQEGFDFEGCLIKDVDNFKMVYSKIEEMLKNNYGYACDIHKYHTTASPNLFARKLSKELNTCILRVAWSVTAWSSHNIEIAKIIADILNEHLSNEKQTAYNPKLKQKDIGYK